MKLSADQVKRTVDTGTYGDGGGLYLQVAPNGTKSWIYRYQIAKRRRWMGLGGFPEISLANARQLRNQHRLQVKAGIDPIEVKRENTTKAVEERKKSKAQAMTFERCAEDFIAQKEPEWKSAKHAQQWQNTLKHYAFPIIGLLPVGDIENHHILEILQPIWLKKTETATRVRNRIELILDYASALKFRAGDNPARWRGNLDAILPKPSKVKNVKHHTALPYDDMSQFMAELLGVNGLAAKALILTILTATRTSEVLNARWSEFNLDKRTWTIPSERMKTGKAHRIPLSAPAVDLLNNIKDGSKSKLVFPGQKQGKSLSNMAMTNTLRRMGRGELTVHGFRSTFRDWVAEKTNYPQRVAETALAHKLKDAAEAAYQRGDLLEKRVQLMQAWAEYCLPKESNVQVLRA